MRFSKVLNYKNFILEALVKYDDELLSIFKKLSSNTDKEVANIASKLIELYGKDVDSRTLRNKEYTFKTTDNFILLDTKSQLKFGRWLQIMLPNEPDHLKAKFTSAFYAINDKKSDNFQIVSGEDINKYYKSEYTKLEGTLKSSCMIDVDVFDLYVKNKSVSMLIYKEDPNKDIISGRAILWKGDYHGEEFMVMDRVYYSSDNIQMLFTQKAIDNTWIYRVSNQAGSNELTMVSNDKNYHVNANLLTIPLTDIMFDRYPYMDTFKYLDIDNKCLKITLNGKEKKYYNLQISGGNFEVYDNASFSILAKYLDISISKISRIGKIFTTDSGKYIVRNEEQVIQDYKLFLYENIDDWAVDHIDKMVQYLNFSKKAKSDLIDKIIEIVYARYSEINSIFTHFSKESISKLNHIVINNFLDNVIDKYDNIEVGGIKIKLDNKESALQQMLTSFSTVFDYNDDSKTIDNTQVGILLLRSDYISKDSLIDKNSLYTLISDEINTIDKSSKIIPALIKKDLYVVDQHINWRNLINEMYWENFHNMEFPEILRFFKREGILESLYSVDSYVSVYQNDVEYFIFHNDSW